MATTRRVVRKLPNSGGQYFDEQLWPVVIALIVLGAFLLGISLAYLPLTGAPWQQTAWPSIIAIPLLVGVGITLLIFADSRLVRRSLQLSFVLCAILHVALVVQMVRTRIHSGHAERPRRQDQVVNRPPPRLVPEYRPTQLIPDEDRPRQDFEKPVETRSPEPLREAEQVVRQPAASDRSPAEPQPVPTNQQERTTQPNIVRRNVPNEAVPRLSAQTSRLSRQPKPSEAKTSELVELPPAISREDKPPELRPSQAAVTPQTAPPLDAPQRAPSPAAPARETSRTEIARRNTAQDPAPAAEAVSVPRASAARPLTEALPSAAAVAAVAPPAAAATAKAAPAGTADDSPQPARLALSRGQAGTAGYGRSANLDSSQPSGESPALVSSGAARRAESTQRGPTGDSLTPSAPARISRARAGAEIPTATVLAEQLDVATAAGTPRVAEITASSSSALVRADSTARRDAVTAAKGSGEIDLGPTQTVTEAQVGRASGGGQPVLNDLVNRQPAPRRTTASAGSLVPPAQLTAAAVAAPDVPREDTQRRAELAPSAVVATRTSATASSSAISPRADVEQSSTASDRVATSQNQRPQRVTDDRDLPSISDLPATSALASRTPAAARESPASGIPVDSVPLPDPQPAASSDATALESFSLGPARLAVTRGSKETMTLDVPEPAGPSGLGTEFTPDVGLNSRQARADSINLQLRAARFVRRDVGGLPAISTAAVMASEAFSSRAARVRGDERAGGSGTPAPLADEAIERGLVFLARHQQPDGSWSLQGFPEGATMVSDTAATALAVIAFQGAGYNHREFQYKDVIRGGLDSLIKSQKENGDLFVPLDEASSKSAWLYSHSLAAIALCEAYGMTQDPALRDPAQRALEFIVASQHRDRGGWRYAPGVSADTSVTGWMMMAMKSGELAGLDVPPAAYAKIRRWLDMAQQSAADPHLYRYNPYAADTPEQRHGRAASKTMTAVGLLMRVYTGWETDDPRMLRGASYLAENLPTTGNSRDQERDTYYWYYATLVLAHVGGEPWQAWNNRLSPLLVNSQISQGPYAGSWDPRAPVPDRWGPHAGRIYVTAMNLLSLEVQNRKLRVSNP